MTYFSQGYFPNIVSVECPQCQKKADFHARINFEIPFKKDVPFFQKHPYFECTQQKNGFGHIRNYATFYYGIHIKNFEEQDLPFSIENMYLRQFEDVRLGSILCIHCGLKRKTQLEWLSQAYYKISYRNQVLWAYDLAHAQILYDYLWQKNRPSTLNSYLLKQVPTIFLKKHARAYLCKKLLKFLEAELH